MVLVFAETSDKQFKKSSLEAVTYARKTADVLGVECVALILGEADAPASLGKFGAHKVVHDTNGAYANVDSQVYSQAIATAADKAGASVVVLQHNSTGKAVAGRVAIKKNAGLVTGVNTVPQVDGGQFTVSKNVFSGKASAKYAISSDAKVLTLMGNTLKPEELGADCAVESVDLNPPAANVEIVSVDKQAGDVAPLPEAELVVSAGRGMKGPENWGCIEELAKELGATTACSRPVADIGWRPHHEHVGQTGVAIRPNLYIAAGISGAIQHLAGVNSSKCIVVINKDPEAPFFKAADYGVCADLFDVVPKLTEALRKAKG